MTIIISIILNIIKNKLFVFCKSKYFLVFLILFIVVIYIVFLNLKVWYKNESIDELSKKIELLEGSNTLLYKNLAFQSNQIYIRKNFSNSSAAIDIIENDALNEETIKALNSIVSDYYNLFTK